MKKLKIFKKAFVLVLILGTTMLALMFLYEMFSGEENILAENILLGTGFITLIVTLGIYFFKKKGKPKSNPNPQERSSQKPS